jgi:NAD(P)H-flavin reductase
MSSIAQAGISATDPLRPDVARITDIIQETPNIKSLRLALEDESLRDGVTFLPGQIGQLSVFGAGEATFAMSSPPSQRGHLQFSIMKTGVVTSAIHDLAAGDQVGLRAPLGCAFPTDGWRGKNIVLVAGGIGMAPLRSLFMHLIDNRNDYERLMLIYGARSPADLCFAEDRTDWSLNRDIEFVETIDRQDDQWQGRVGLLPDVVEAEQPSAANSVAVICGPPIMIRFTLQSLERIGFAAEQIYTTLERRMKCGIGLCGRCNLGEKHVCTDGPVFSLDELKQLPEQI